MKDIVKEPNWLLSKFQNNGVGGHTYSHPYEIYEISGMEINDIIKSIEEDLEIK